MWKLVVYLWRWGGGLLVRPLPVPGVQWLSCAYQYQFTHYSLNIYTLSKQYLYFTASYILSGVLCSYEFCSHKHIISTYWFISTLSTLSTHLRACVKHPTIHNYQKYKQNKIFFRWRVSVKRPRIGWRNLCARKRNSPTWNQRLDCPTVSNFALNSAEKSAEIDAPRYCLHDVSVG